MLNLVNTYTPLEVFPDIYIIAGTPFLYLADIETVVCGDLHIGELAHVTNRGISKPIFKDDTLKPALNALQQIDGIVNFSQIIFNGDIKHQTRGTNSVEQDQLQDFFQHELISSKSCILIKGNHDPYLELSLRLIPENCSIANEVNKSRYFIHHGHQLLENESAEVIILSHEHPAFMMKGNNFENVRVPAFVTLYASTKQFVIILPSASALPSGVPFPPRQKRQFMSPFLKTYGDLGTLTLYPFDPSIGSFIYPIQRK